MENIERINTAIEQTFDLLRRAFCLEDGTLIKSTQGHYDKLLAERERLLIDDPTDKGE